MVYLVIILCAFVVYCYLTREFNYWRKRNVKHDKPMPLFGNHFTNLIGSKSITEIATNLYNKFPEEKVIGYFIGRTPVLVIRDLDLVKDILTTDFSYFYKRGLGRDTKTEPLLANLFHSEGDTWKLLRQRLTPAFTSAKLKKMFPLISRCAGKLQNLVEEIVLEGGECDVRDLMARYTVDFIAACGFGIETDTMSNENSLYINIGRWIVARPLKHLILKGAWELFPEIRGLYKVADPRIEKAISAIIRNIRNQRGNEPSGRNDFIDLLLELEAMGKIKGESIEKTNTDGSLVPVEMNIDLQCMAAQVFIFLAAGFETSSSATSYTLHQLAFHPEIQLAVQNEIDAVLSKYNNVLCFEAVSEINLLDMAFKESMRIFPSVGVLHRECVKEYFITKLGISIDPGVKVIIPVQAIQTDAKYFDNPHEFCPERFKCKGHTERLNYVYLPFGEGPRKCIGARLGRIESIAGLAAILHKFSVEPSKKTHRKVQVDHRKNIIQGVLGGLPLKLKKRITNI